MRLDVGPGLTVVTGPSGVGKTNLGACLDLGRVIVACAAGVSGTDQDRATLYEGAGYFGAPSYRVAIDLELDQARERALVSQCTGLGPPPDIAALNDQVQALQQENLDLRRRAEEREEELAAAREANRRLMNQVNQPGPS
jgi:hypothetical protein